MFQCCKNNGPRGHAEVILCDSEGGEVLAELLNGELAREALKGAEDVERRVEEVAPERLRVVHFALRWILSRSRAT